MKPEEIDNLWDVCSSMDLGEVLAEPDMECLRNKCVSELINLFHNKIPARINTFSYLLWEKYLVSEKVSNYLFFAFKLYL